MKIIHIFGLVASAACMLLAAQGCSDNYDSTLVPVKSKIELMVDGHASGFSVDYGAEPNSDIVVSVESNTLWKVEIECTGGWCSADKLTGRGNESFTLSILENINKERNAFVNVYVVDENGDPLAASDGQVTSIQMTLKQAVSDVRLSPASFEPFKAQGNERTRMQIVSNVAWTLDVTYEGENPIQFVNITPSDGVMNPTGDGSYSGDGNASFDLTIADNRTAAERRAFINLRSAVDNYSVEIRQNKSEYTFDVSPTENQIVKAEGGTLEFGIYSLSDWYIESANGLNDWITFSPAEGSASSSRLTTIATIKPNTTGSERSAHIEFVARQEQYGKMSVDIIQQTFPSIFTIGRSDAIGVVSEKGDELSLELDSRFRWESSASSWLKLNPSRGEASASSIRISVGVDANYTHDNRTGTVTITPLPTEVAAGITLDPSALGIQPLHLSVTQAGGREVAISVPWLRDGYTQTSATVEFNFYSPFYAIEEAGLEWGKEGSADISTLKVTPSNSTDCTVSFELTNLDPATKYVARGYVRDELGNVKHGNWSFPFTTAGQYPGSGDNPPVSK